MAKNIKSDDIATSGAVVKKSHLMSPSTLMTIIFCSLYFLMYLDRINISMAAKPIMREFNLSNAGLGIVFSAFSWPYLVGQWIGGWSANRFGVRNVLTFCVFLVAVATLAGGIAIGLAVLCAARLFVGIGEGPVFSAATQGMKHWYSGKRYGFIQGVTHGASRFGAAVSPIIVAWCIVISGWRAAFFVCAVLTLIWVALWWWNFVEDPRDHPNITEAEVAELVPPNKQVRHVRTPWWPLIKRIFPVTAVEFTTGWMTWVFISWLPLYFMSRFHLDLKSSAMHTAIALISGVIGDIFGGLASDWILVKTGNKRLARNAFIALCLLLAGGFLAATMLTIISSWLLCFFSPLFSLRRPCAEQYGQFPWISPMNMPALPAA